MTHLHVMVGSEATPAFPEVRTISLADIGDAGRVKSPRGEQLDRCLNDPFMGDPTMPRHGSGWPAGPAAAQRRLLLDHGTIV